MEEPVRRQLTPETPTPWRAVEAIPVVLAAAVVSFLGGAVVWAVFPGGTALVLSGLVFEAALGGATLIWALGLRGGDPASLGLARRGAGRHLGFGLVAGAGLFAVTVFVIAPLFYGLVGLFTSQPVTPPQQEVLPSGPSTAQVILGGVVVVLAAPIAEELFFRGFLFGALRSRFRFATAALVSAAVFGVFHVIPLLMPLMAVVGLGLAWLYERRGSLLVCIAAHAAFNVVGYSFIVRAAS